MPGGRGTILDIANSLNNTRHTEIADAVKTAIDSGYRVANTSIPLLGAAFSTCDQPASLSDIWCYANDKGAVDWGEY